MRHILLHGRSLGALAFALALLLAACVEPDAATSDSHHPLTSFAVTPNLIVSGTDYQGDVVLHRIFLGVGSVILEPIDDLQAPIISNRQAVALTFDLSSQRDTALAIPDITVPAPGRYLVSIAFEPMQDGDSALQQRAYSELQSVELDGIYYTAKAYPESDPILSPEPVPWEPTPFAQSSTDALELGQIDQHSFTYRSQRTGFIRVGEVELGAEQTQLNIRIHLDTWLSDALEPLLADLAATPDTTTLDLSARLDSSGIGLEKLFLSSEAEAF